MYNVLTLLTVVLIQLLLCTQVRKMMTVAGMLGPAVMLPLFGYTTSSLLAAMFVLSVLMGLATINLSGVLANHLDIAPHNVGEMQVLECATTVCSRYCNVLQVLQVLQCATNSTGTAMCYYSVLLQCATGTAMWEKSRY
jgi:hypothetical protein